MSEWFESFANSKRYKTFSMRKCFYCGLRALLIQKDTKPSVFTAVQTYGLRALLIQKDTKP